MNTPQLRRSTKVLLTSLLAVSLFSILTVVAAPAFERTPTIKLQFTTPTTFDDAVRIVHDNHLIVEEITVGEEGTGREPGLTHFSGIAGRDLESVRSEFISGLSTFLRFYNEKIRSVSPPSTNEVADRLQRDLAQGRVYLRTITIRVPRGTTLPIIPGTRIVQDAQGRESAVPPDDNTLDGTGPKSWAPYTGSSDVTQYYTSQTFVFRGPPSSSSTATYEHETVLSDKNFANYVNYTASTNMPSGYVDCTWFDSDDKFTIGCSKANQLAGYVTYWTYMGLSPQSSRSSSCKIRGQLGHRSPSWCYIPCTCIFADDTADLISFTAPAGISWVY